MIEQSLACGGSAKLCRFLVLRNLRTSAWSEDARPLRPVFIGSRESRCSPDRCLEPAKLPLDGFPEVLQQVEAIGDLLRPGARAVAHHRRRAPHGPG